MIQENFNKLKGCFIASFHSKKINVYNDEIMMSYESAIRFKNPKTRNIDLICDLYGKWFELDNDDHLFFNATIREFPKKISSQSNVDFIKRYPSSIQDISIFKFPIKKIEFGKTKGSQNINMIRFVLNNGSAIGLLARISDIGIELVMDQDRMKVKFNTIS